MLDEIIFEYDVNVFDWTNSKLYYFLCDHYGLNSIQMVLKDNKTITIEKYNVIGYVEGNSYITIYDNIGELNPISFIGLPNIKSCRVIK